MVFSVASIYMRYIQSVINHNDKKQKKKQMVCASRPHVQGEDVCFAIKSASWHKKETLTLLRGKETESAP